MTEKFRRFYDQGTRAQFRLDKMESNEKIERYYNENQVFYDLLWMNRVDLSMNYGFWDENTKNIKPVKVNLRNPSESCNSLYKTVQNNR